MSISWIVTDRQGVAVVAVAGFLGARAVTRFSEGLAWAASRSSGRLIRDLSGLLGWSFEGEKAGLSTAAGLRKGGRSLAVCGVEHMGLTEVWAARVSETDVYVDVDTALVRRVTPHRG